MGGTPTSAATPLGPTSHPALTIVRARPTRHPPRPHLTNPLPPCCQSDKTPHSQQPSSTAHQHSTLLTHRSNPQPQPLPDRPRESATFPHPPLAHPLTSTHAHLTSLHMTKAWSDSSSPIPPHSATDTPFGERVNYRYDPTPHPIRRQCGDPIRLRTGTSCAPHCLSLSPPPSLSRSRGSPAPPARLLHFHSVTSTPDRHQPGPGYPGPVHHNLCHADQWESRHPSREYAGGFLTRATLSITSSAEPQGRHLDVIPGKRQRPPRQARTTSHPPIRQQVSRAVKQTTPLPPEWAGLPTRGPARDDSHGPRRKQSSPGAPSPVRLPPQAHRHPPAWAASQAVTQTTGKTHPPVREQFPTGHTWGDAFVG